MMNTENKKTKSDEQINFINHFVNAVYAVLLGYGFSNSMRDITDGKPESVGTVFSVVSVIFIITVICVNWWDWFKNISKKVQPDVKEFAIDMAILITIIWLFFVYDHPIFFSAIFLLLSILSLLWVYNYHRSKYKRTKLSWKKFLIKNKKIKQHISNRIKSVIIFEICLFITIILEYISIDIETILFNQNIPEYLYGNWLQLFIIIITFVTNRIVFYRERPL